MELTLTGAEVNKGKQLVKQNALLTAQPLVFRGAKASLTGSRNTVVHNMAYPAL